MEVLYKLQISIVVPINAGLVANKLCSRIPDASNFADAFDRFRFILKGGCSLEGYNFKKF